MSWGSEPLFNKAKLFARRAHEQPVNSALFGFWMSLALELLARSALARIHPVLLADPREPDNIHFAFGVQPRRAPSSIAAKALYARCSVFIQGFTDKMSAHCLILAERRNSELHSGAAAFEDVPNSSWLPRTYEVMEVLIAHLGRDFADFLGEHSSAALSMLADRRETIARDVRQKLADAKAAYSALSAERRAERLATADAEVGRWAGASKLRRGQECPACGNPAAIAGEVVSRGQVRVDEEAGRITFEARVLPNRLLCPHCGLTLSSFQEVREAGRGDVFTVEERVDPIAFFGIDPEEYVDVEELLARYARDAYGEYENE